MSNNDRFSRNAAPAGTGFAIRLSVGLEDAEDIIADLRRGLEAL